MPSEICAWCDVTLTTCGKLATLRSGDHVTKPCYFQDTDSDTVQLDFNTFSIFSTQFTIDIGTLGADEVLGMPALVGHSL